MGVASEGGEETPEDVQRDHEGRSERVEAPEGFKLHLSQWDSEHENEWGRTRSKMQFRTT